MFTFKKELITSFGNSEKIECQSYRPEPYDLLEAYYQTDLKPLARGFGKSYSNCALGDKIINTNRLDHFISFDKQLGIITVQAGISVAEILSIVIPYGWLLPIMPGTKNVSIGGCIANNVHGKNHYIVGDFSRSIIGLKLRLVSNELIECSRDINSEIFFATIAGLGMTGFIEQATLKLKPINSSKIQVTSKEVANLNDMVEEFRKNAASAEYMVGWIDHFAIGKSLGQGIFESACHKNDNDLEYEANEPYNIHFNLPSFILNNYVIRLFNKFRFNNLKPVTTSGSLRFFFPLDQINDWYKAYGKQGLVQYQFVLPDNQLIGENITKILRFLQQHGAYAKLIVIKYHKNSEGYMSFPIKGFSVALDFSYNDKIKKLFNDLDEMMCQMQGRVYLAKNNNLSKSYFYQMYGENFAAWQNILQKLDPKKQLLSVMSQNLGFKDYDSKA